MWASVGSYDSDKAACLTLDEVEHWLAIAVAKYYHQRPHEGLDGQTPLRRWQEGVTSSRGRRRQRPSTAGSARIPGGLSARVASQPAA